jgi:hypothetical protein
MKSKTRMLKVSKDANKKPSSHKDVIQDKKMVKKMIRGKCLK